MDNKTMDSATLLSLLYATYNIGGNAQPEEDYGIVVDAAAQLMAERLFPTEADIKAKLDQLGYDLKEIKEIDPEAIRTGVEIATHLYVECDEQGEQAKAYADLQIKLGNEGIRVMDNVDYKRFLSHPPK